ncbi:hypothetical protein [Persephonella sp.]
MKTIDIQKQIKKYGKVNFVKGELLKRGYSLKDFARNVLGIHENFLYQMLYKDARSKRVAKQIEDFLEVPRGSLFPYLLESVENSKEKSEDK